MSTTRVALMGFGRIGRNLFRILYKNPDIRVAAISDVSEPSALEYLLRFDTILGRFPDEISVHGQHLYVGGQQIPMLRDDPNADLPWRQMGVDLVVEATRRNLSRSQIQRHLDAGAKRVILCIPSLDPPDATIAVGLNDEKLRPEHRIISNASCTAHCAAPVLMLLNKAFGIRRAFLSTVHAYTNEQRLADVPTEDKRRGRAAAENIIPQASNAAKVVTQLLPELEGRISSMAMNVPVPNGSVVDLVCWHERPVTVTAINEVIRTAVASSRRGILGYEDEPIVSSDVIRSTCSGIFDSLATMVMGDNVSKTLSWYDNGWGYAHRVVDLIHKLREIDGIETNSGAEREAA